MKKQIKPNYIQEVQLIYKTPVDAEPRTTIKSSCTAHTILRKSWDANRIELLEEFKILLLNRRNACVGIANIAVGGSASCIVDPRVIFATALKANAAGIILSYNHPSGNHEPSLQDLDITQQLCQAGNLLKINVLDHIIMTSKGFYSMADHGVMPTIS